MKRKHTVHIPTAIHNVGVVLPPPPAPAEPPCKILRPATDYLSPEEWTLYTAMLAPGQQRSELLVHRTLQAVAKMRSDYIAQHEHVSHSDRDGFGPNWHVRKAGYRLPEWYGQAIDSNNIESLSYGASSPAQAWQLLMESPGHRAHLLGEVPMFAEQTRCGIGATRLHAQTWVFVILTAHPE